MQTKALPTIITMMGSTTNVAIGLLALCRVVGSAASSEMFDPHVFTEEEKQYIIDTYAGERFKQYAKVRALSSRRKPDIDIDTRGMTETRVPRPSLRSP